YEKVIKRIENIAKDPSVSEVAISLLNELIIIIYPDDIFNEKENLLLGSLLIIAYEHLQIGHEALRIAENLNLSLNDLMNVVSKYKKYLENNPPIKA
ncbi:MAG: hypothetical protein WC127_00805, partial [Acidaminococcaceae bacterium]